MYFPEGWEENHQFLRWDSSAQLPEQFKSPVIRGRTLESYHVENPAPAAYLWGPEGLSVLVTEHRGSWGDCRRGCLRKEQVQPMATSPSR